MIIEDSDLELLESVLAKGEYDLELDNTGQVVIYTGLFRWEGGLDKLDENGLLPDGSNPLLEDDDHDEVDPLDN